MMLSGSANLTAGGMFRNHELGVAFEFQSPQHPALAQVRAALDSWQTPSAFCQLVTPALIRTLHVRGDLPSEATQRVARRAARTAAAGSLSATRIPSPFGASARILAPSPGVLPKGLPEPPIAPSASETSVSAVTSAESVVLPTVDLAFPPKSLVMEVVPHHNGEVFLSKSAINDDPVFFGYPFNGWSVPKRAGNSPYPNLDPAPIVEIVIYDSKGAVLKHKNQHPLYVVEYERKSEIRMTIPERLHDYIPPGSIMVMTKDPVASLDYRLSFYPPGGAPANVASHLVKQLPSGGSALHRHYGWM